MVWENMKKREKKEIKVMCALLYMMGLCLALGISLRPVAKEAHPADTAVSHNVSDNRVHICNQRHVLNLQNPCNAVANETVVEISVSVCSAVGCDQQVCTVKIRSIDRSKLDLYRPLAELAYRSRSIISRGS